MVDGGRTKVPNSLKKAQEHNFLWTSVLTFKRQSGDVPMWIDWISRYGPQEESTQKVWYLKQKNESPISSSVVEETLKRLQKVSEECNKYNISVTYDLAIAKVAMQLQAEEKPTYDNVFIHLGPFHITCAFFFMLGKYLAESGGSHILNETRVIENGSLTHSYQVNLITDAKDLINYLK